LVQSERLRVKVSCPIALVASPPMANPFTISYGLELQGWLII
jgi:hypothetical protein